MRRPTALALLALAALQAPPAPAAPSPAVIGVLLADRDADGAAAHAAFAEALRLVTKDRPELVERTVPADDAQVGAALGELRSAGAAAIVAFGTAATSRVRDSLRDLPAVFAAPDPSIAAELRAGGGACVAAGLPAAAMAAEFGRTSPSLRAIGVYVPAGDEAARAASRDAGGDLRTVVAEGDGASPTERAKAAVAALLPAAGVVWLPPSVSAADAAALAEAMSQRGVPLVGSTAAHLDAGCAVVIRSDPRDLGALAAVLAVAVLDGADPAKIPVRRPRRRLIEVNLGAAQKLGFRVPPPLLAWADRVIRPRAVLR